MRGNTILLGHKHSDETKEKIGKATSLLFKTEQYQKKWAEGVLNLPNKLEKFFDEITPKEVKYTGNGKFFLTLKDGKIKNPDFVIEHSRKVIELFGDYWHRNDNPQELIQQYNQIGFDCLIFWESEVLNDTQIVIDKVNNFIKS